MLRKGLIWIHMFHAMVWFTLILCCSCICLQWGLIISGMLVQVRTTPKHRSTHISNYQSIERESYERDETSLTRIPMCPRERFSHYKKLSRLVLCYKKDWATLLHLVYFWYLLPVMNYLIIQLSVIDNFNACREYLAENRLSFPSAPRCVRHSYKYRGSIIVLSISKSVEPNKEQKEMTSGFQQGILWRHWNYR